MAPAILFLEEIQVPADMTVPPSLRGDVGNANEDMLPVEDDAVLKRTGTGSSPLTECRSKKLNMASTTELGLPNHAWKEGAQYSVRTMGTALP